MKILIFGYKGWIGTELCNLLNNFNEYELILSDIRVENSKEVEELIISSKPDRIISVIGRTHSKDINSVDFLEKKGNLKININDNLFSPFVLAFLSNKYNIHLTYIGTGCIFDGYDKKYSETDEPNFYGSSYSVVKGFTEKIMKFYDNVLNVRIRMPISNDLKSNRNFISKISNYKKIYSMYNSMTYLPDLLPVLIDMIIKKETGTINLVNPGSISHNQILELYKKYINPELEWENITIEELNNTILAEKSNIILDTSKLQSLYPQVKDINICIDSLFKSIKNTNT